jgi:very-short-patch-repair endonuclease
MAAVLASGTEAVLSHWSAVALWGIRPSSRTRIHVTVPYVSRSSTPISRHVSLVPDDERTVEDGIPVTTVPRTIFDLAATEPLDVVKAMLREKDEPLDERKSLFEDRLVPFLRRHSLPRPRFNDWILVGNQRFQVDCLWPEQRQVVELDGWQGHKTRTAFREDRARDRRLRVAGYGVTRLTWSQLEDEPESVASDLRVCLGDR